MVAVLQWQEDPPRHALRGVPRMGRRPVFCSAGVAQLASRAGDCRHGSKQKTSIPSVSLVLDYGQ